MIGLIHITPLMDELIEDLINNRDPQYYKIFREEDLKIDIAKEIIAQSYLTYEQEMLIVIAANKYNIAAQNALLKIIEEPPEKVQFIIIAKSIKSYIINYFCSCIFFT